MTRFEGAQSDGDPIQQLGKAAFTEGADGWADARLLESFLDTHDRAAFEVLVRRHGPMVLGVCHRVLGNPQDAQDAFQATFLVLVRKAASIVPREMVGNWLYGVAYQTAVKARAMAGRRAAKERQVMNAPEPATTQTDEALWRELRPIIDEELNRLPAKYRAPIVLCDIEEKSYKEAAKQLGWPEGTVAGRLSRARAMLADRLTRRGVVLTAVALPLLLTQNAAAAAAVPAALVIPTVEAATLVAAGQATTGAVSAPVVALTEEVVKAMTLAKLKIATALLLGVCLTVAGVGFAFTAPPGQDQKKAAPLPAQQQPPVKPADQKVDPKAAPKNGNGKNGPNGNNNQKGNNEPNGKNNQQGNNEKNGDNNQQGNNEKNGDNNQKGNNEPNGNNNQKGKNEPNGKNNQQGNNEKNGKNNQQGNGNNPPQQPKQPQQPPGKGQ